jgi:hypothetical protein
MKKFIRDLWEVLVERTKIHKAMRLLAKQEWSVEFLTALLVRASNVTHQPLEMVLQSPGGAKLVVRTVEIKGTRLPDDNIFDHLDDDAKIRAFMEAAK